MFKKVLKGVVWGLLGLVLLALAFYTVEDVRGKRTWEQHKRECAARGENIGDWLSLIPPPIPDEDNVAMTPIFQDLLANPRRKSLRLPSIRFPTDTNTVQGAVWQTGVYQGLDPYRVALSNDNLLAALSVYDDDLREVEEALKRPLFRHAGWDNASVTITNPVPYDAPLPHVNLSSLIFIYNVRAMARYEAGQYDKMLEDIQTGFRLSELDKENPLHISVTLRGFMGMSCAPLWLGLNGHAWNAQQLTTLQAMLEEINLAEHLVLANRAERSFSTFLLLLPRRSIPNYYWVTYSLPKIVWYLTPRGWFYQNAVQYAKFLERQERIIHTDDRWFDIAQLQHIIETPKNHPYFFVARECGLSTANWMINHLALAQATRHQAVIACAIERYRLENMRIPERLDDLVPQFLAKVPCDPCDGQPMRYKPEGEGGYILYSVSINGVDDGGQLGISERYKNTVDREGKSGDWVWRSSPPAAGND